MRIIYVLSCIILPLVISGQRTEYAFNPSNAYVEFATKHLGVIPVDGSFGEFTGFVIVNNSMIDSIYVRIESGSLTTDSEDRDKTVRGPEFLGVEEFPAINFAANGPAALRGPELIGMLQIRDVTRQVTITFNSEAGPDRTMVIEGQTQLSRKHFNLKFGGMDDLVADKVKVTFRLQLQPSG